LDTTGLIVWSPDSEWIVFSARKDGAGPRLYRVSSRQGAEAEELTSIAAYDVPSSVVGNQVMFHRQVGGRFDLLTVSLHPPWKPERFLGDGSILIRGRISPDGRYVAYESNEVDRGTRQVLLRPRDNPERYREIVAAPATSPRWGREGRRLFYKNDEGIWARRINAVAGDGRPGLGAPERIVEAAKLKGLETEPLDPAPDERRFLAVKRPPRPREEFLLTYVPNWIDYVKQEFRKSR
jgi:hypothetical protein